MTLPFNHVTEFGTFSKRTLKNKSSCQFFYCDWIQSQLAAEWFLFFFCLLMWYANSLCLTADYFMGISSVPKHVGWQPELWLCDVLPSQLKSPKHLIKWMLLHENSFRAWINPLLQLVTHVDLVEKCFWRVFSKNVTTNGKSAGRANSMLNTYISTGSE